MSPALIPKLAAMENIAVSRRDRAGLFAAASMTIPTSLAEKAGRSFLRGAGRAVNAVLKSLHIFLERRYSHRCLSVEVTLSMLDFR